MGQEHIRAMDVEEAADGELRLTDVAEAVRQGRAEQRPFYAALVANKGIPDRQLQQHVALLRTHLAVFDRLYTATPSFLPSWFPRQVFRSPTSRYLRRVAPSQSMNFSTVLSIVGRIIIGACE